MDSPERDPFEDRLRDVLRSNAAGAPDPDGFLADVHQGAKSRRRRQVVGTAAAVLLVAGGGVAFAESSLVDNGRTPVATGPSRTPGASSTSPSTADTSDTTPSPTKAGEGGWGGVLSLTSTGSGAQWALAADADRGCGQRPDESCAVVLQSPVGDDDWVELGEVGVPTATDPADADRSQRYQVSQIRFVGNAGTGYDGWAFGGGLLSSHGSEAGVDWSSVSVPTIGPATELEAHGGTVYAVFQGTTSTLWTSPVSSDDFSPVDTGFALGTASDLVVSGGVVAFLNSSAVGDTIAIRDADAAWSQDNPCQVGEPAQLSTAVDSLWALCTRGKESTILVKRDDSSSWQAIRATYDADALLAARSAVSALVAESDGVSLVSLRGSRRLVSNDFTHATMFGFTNDRVGFVVIDGQVLRTDDGGLSWAADDVTP